MSTLQPLLSRDRYTDEEWAYALSGRCGWVTESGMTPQVKRCREPSSPDSVYRYCADYDADAREHPTYGN